jgi:hypothetical protein
MRPSSDAINKTVPGITILQERPSKACDSLHCNVDGDSNDIDESDLHGEKHDEQRISRSFGI